MLIKPKNKKIAIVHYRVGRTDGVSLEIEKRKSILQACGHDVKLISGPIQENSDFIIDELEFDLPEIREIKENSFKYFGTKSFEPAELMQKIHAVAARIEKAFLKYHQQQRFDALLLHNIFSHGRHIAAASAFSSIVQQLKLPVVATNHDYYWERAEYQAPAYNLIKKYLESYVPPANENITYVNINSLAQSALKARKGIESTVYPDVFDFQQKRWTKDDYNADFLEHAGLKANDLIVLQATRIVERKGIELAIDFVKELTKQKDKLIGKKLYNGKILTKDSTIVLVLAGYAEESAKHYLEKLKNKIAASGIQAKFIHHSIGANRNNAAPKIYSLWDAYVYADLVTYPSLFEGWGNQFIEAIFAKKPLVVFEYPVFKSDIKPEGYFYISFGDKITKQVKSELVKISDEAMAAAVNNTIKILISDRTLSALNNNFQIGKQYHDYEVLRHFLEINIDLLTYEKRFMESVRQGLEDAEAGRTVTTKELIAGLEKRRTQKG